MFNDQDFPSKEYSFVNILNLENLTVSHQEESSQATGFSFEEQADRDLLLAPSFSLNQEDSVFSGLKIGNSKPTNESTEIFETISFNQSMQCEKDSTNSVRSIGTSDVPVNFNKKLDRKYAAAFFTEAQSLHSKRYSKAVGASRPLKDMTSREKYEPFAEKQLHQLLSEENSSISNSKGGLGIEIRPDPHDFTDRIANDMAKLNLQNLNRNISSEMNEYMYQGSKLSFYGAQSDYLSTNSELSLSSNYVDVCIKNLTVASGRNEEILDVNKQISDKRVEEIANQLYAFSHINNTGTDNSDNACFLHYGDISSEYCQLYSQIRPEDYDFAMNIMAFIELLNETSWKATVSYFDENTKRMVQDIWIQKKDRVNNMPNLQNFKMEAFLILIDDFTEWSRNRKYDFVEFLNYCVLMCQLGVLARNYGFKEAPLIVISRLRDGIKLLKFEDLVETLFEICAKEYAQKLFPTLL